MIKILVTGSKGQLGSEIYDLVLAYPDFQFNFIDIEDIDLTDFKAVQEYLNTGGFQYCINCAAYTAVDKAEDEKELAFLVNVKALENLAYSCRNNDVFLFHISTDYVFDGNQHKPYVETDKPAPQTVYGQSKLEGEWVLSASRADYIIIRTSWLYSAYGHNFVKTMIRLGAEKSSINVVADQAGTPTNAADLARSILDIILKIKEENVGEIYHYSNEGICSWYDFAHAIMAEIQSDCKVIPIDSKDFPAKAARPFYSVLSKTKIKENFGLQIPQWQESLSVAIKKLSEKH